MVRSGEGLQRARDGPARSFPRGPLHLLRPAVHNEDRPYASRPGKKLHLEKKVDFLIFFQVINQELIRLSHGT